MNNFNIGFIGGCVSNQKGIKRSDLYYSVLIQKLKNARLNTNPAISLGSYTSYDELVEKTIEFVTLKKPSHIFLFVRPFPLMLLHKPIITYDKKENKRGYLIHPKFIKQKYEWPKSIIYTRENPNYIFKPKPKFALRDLNLLVGILLGLHRWSMNYLELQFSKILGICNSNGVGFTLISPPKNPESSMGNLICQWTTHSLKSYCKSNSIHMIDINSLSESIIGKDGLHLTEKGHAEIADLVFLEVNKLI